MATIFTSLKDFAHRLERVALKGATRERERTVCILSVFQVQRDVP